MKQEVVIGGWKILHIEKRPYPDVPDYETLAGSHGQWQEIGDADEVQMG